MDELEALKAQWQTREHDLPKLSYNEIYKMLLKKSSSIVKWIFIISILELIFWVSLVFLIPESQEQLMDDMGIKTFSNWSNVFHFAVILVFIWFFYKNFKLIQVTDSTKKLMTNILRTRKTVRYFVYYNIGMFILSSILVNIYFYYNIDHLYEVLSLGVEGVPKENFGTMFMIIQIICGVVVLGLLMLFYWLIYGILLGRLKRNYQELKKLEV